MHTYTHTHSHTHTERSTQALDIANDHSPNCIPNLSHT